MHTFEHARQDLRYGWRQLRRHPRFTAAAVVTIALGVSVTTVIVTVASAVLFRPLPYREPEQLVQLWNTFRDVGENVVFSHLEYRDYRARIRGFEDLAAFGRDSETVRSAGEPHQAWVSTVSSNLFDLLGARPLHGRGFQLEDVEPGRDRVVVLSHGFWQGRFGADPAIVGSSMTVAGEPHVIVGIMPSTFRSLSADTDLWRPLALAGDVFDERQRGSRSLWMIGRLKPGVSLDAARREMAAHAQHLAAEHPENYPEQAGHVVSVVPLHDQVTGQVRAALLALLGAVGMLMAIACANVTSLLLAQATERETEMAVRAAIGASRSRLLSQVFTESVLLAILGGAVGTVAAAWGVDLLLHWVPAGVLPRMDEISFGTPMLWFSLGLSLLTGLTFGAAPALRARASRLADALKGGGPGFPSGRRDRLRRLLTAGQVALAVVLLVGAGLLIRSFTRLLAVPAGFNAENVLAMRLVLPLAKYDTRARQVAFFEELTETTRALPGVEAVGLVTSLPFSGWRNDWGISLEGIPGADGSGQGSLPLANYFAVSADYFRAMGIPLLRGRPLAGADATGPPAVIVNESLARRFWPNQDPLGKRLKMGGAGSPWPWRTVVGIVGDVRQTNLETAVMPEIFVLHADERRPTVPSMFVVVRAGTDPAPLVVPIRQALAKLDADQPIASVRRLSELVSLTMAERRFHLLLLGLFAAAALTLTAVGVHGIIAGFVGQRTREIGLRIAFGAERRDVVRLVIGQGLWLSGAGAAVGLVGALGMGRLLESLLFQVDPTDAVTLVSVIGLVFAVALVACWLPARRASRLAPIDALRHQ